MKKTYYLLGTCFIASITMVLILFLLSEDLARRPNSFLRILPPHPAIQKKNLDIKYNSYYIAGATNHTVYLGNYTAPLHLLVIDKTLTDSQHVKINIPNIEKEKFWTVRVKVDSPNFFVTDGAKPRIYSGNVNTWDAERIKYDSAYFVDLVPISNNSFAIRSLTSFNQEYELGKETEEAPYIKLMPDILEKQIDGQFCVDGMMNYDKAKARLVYTYFYRNQYIVMDSNLNVKYRGSTIDTTSKAKIKVASIASNKSKTMSSPPLMVNRHSCLSDRWLFVNSNLMAKNESLDGFKDLSVVDVYDLEEGQYKFSFYLSHYTKNKVKDFRVAGDKLFAIFDRFIVVFDLVPKYFERKP